MLRRAYRAVWDGDVLDESLHQQQPVNEKHVRKQAKLERQISNHQSKIEKLGQRNSHKLDGLQRKLARKQERLEKIQRKQQERADRVSQPITEESQAADYEKYVNKLEKQLSKTQNRAEQLSRKITDVKNTIAQEQPKEPQCSIVKQEDSSVTEAVVEEQKIEMSAVEQPTEQPAIDSQQGRSKDNKDEEVSFKYQDEFKMVSGMGFEANPDVLRYLLIENKGDITKVINTLLSSMS